MSDRPRSPARYESNASGLGDRGIFFSLFNDEKIAAIFSAPEFVRYMLEVEAALASAQGRLGVIPADAAAAIGAGVKSITVDHDEVQNAIETAGVPVAELVRQLRRHVGGQAGQYVHWGATTQDIMDTALVLQLRAAVARLETDLNCLILNLAEMADRHRNTLMAGRTHSQQALPMTFGLKVAGWLAPLLRHRDRLAEIRPRLFVIQLGGAVGTLAALGSEGPAVQLELASALALGLPLGVWHTQRDIVAEFAGWLSLVTGSLGKMAQDIILLAQSEVGEARESADRTRGGSSTMPQKSNPMVSEAILAIHRTNAGHLSALHNALVHEHERATHGWQVEWLNLPPMVSMTAAALTRAMWLSENLVVDADRMQANVAASNGVMLGEAVTFALAEHIPRAEAKQVVQDAVLRAASEDRHLVDVLREQIDFPLDWESLREERNYLGATDEFIDRIINSADTTQEA